MNRIALVLFALVLHLPADADEGLPRLAVDGRNLDIVEALVSIELEGRIAEIIYEIAYQNNTAQRQEGEFSLRLPDGATVSTYAIDVLGAMRPAVSVEKERARNAYESIKRREVDPGLVERRADNVYRNRVFPIEPKSTKRVRIGYLRELGTDGLLELPLACEGRIGRFELTVKNPSGEPVFKDFASIKGERPDARTWKWTGSDVRLSGSLQIRTIPPWQVKEYVRIEGPRAGVRHFVIQGNTGVRQDGIPPLWRRVRLVWDASYTGRFRDHAVEFAALDRIWQWLENAEVTVHTLSVNLSPEKTIPVREGNGKGVKDALGGVVYDGSADYSQLDDFDGVTILVGDGMVSSSAWGPPKRAKSHPFFLINSDGIPVSPQIRAYADAVLDPSAEDLVAPLLEHIDSPFIDELEAGNWCVIRKGDYFRITGVLPPDAPAKIRFGGGGISGREIDTVPTTEGDEWNFTRRLWAQDRLSELERQNLHAAIIAHAMAERLASDLTSLIVLERMQDHVRYRIPPPEPDLLTAYQGLLSRENLQFNHAAAASWHEKLLWYERAFPWIDTELREEAAAVAIFTRAARTVFDENQVRGTNLPALEAWLPGTELTLAAATKIDSDAAFGTWKTGARQQMKALHAIREKSKTDPSGLFSVSVRGFVKEHGIFPGEAPFFINAAIARAGGPAFGGSLSRVYLYRDGQRTGYDLESPQALPVPLRPGDMIVVENRASAYGYTAGFADPFSDGFSGVTPAVGRGGAPVFETTGSVKPATRATQPSDSPGGRQTSATTGSISHQTSDLPVASGANGHFLDALKTHTNPAAFYRESLAGDFGKEAISMATIVEAARILYSRDESELAYRVLTILCELEPNPVEATRALAIWLCEFGEMDRAKQILRSLLSSTEDAGTRALVQHDLARLAGESAQFAEAVTTEAKMEANWNSPVLLPVLLTDLFENAPNTRAPFPRIKSRAMPSDLRIIVTTAGGDASLSVDPPHRHALNRDGVIFEDSDPAWHHRHPRLYEYQIRRCLPGAHLPSLIPGNSHDISMTARVDLYLRWGRKDQERRSFTFLLERDPIALPAVDFEWGADK